MRTLCKNMWIALILFISILIHTPARGSFFNTSEAVRAVTGLEVFVREYAATYRGKNAVLITNHSGVDYSLKHNIDLLRESGIRISVVMAPEHGIYGYQNDYDKKEFMEDPNYKLLVYNMHLLSKGSLKFLFERADLVIFDIQDMGMRCYTYISNLKTVMDSMDGARQELIVLDRPNPISFIGTDGAYLEKKFKSRFVSSFPAPFIYNMTIGEAALYYRGEFRKKVNLKVIAMKNYSRGLMYHETGFPWIPPSPNLPTYESSIVYAAVVMMEGINISLGRGTAKPFEYIGAPWIDPVSFARELEQLGFYNFKFKPVYFSPSFSLYANEICGGVQIFYLGGKFSPAEFSYKVIGCIMKKYKNFEWHTYGRSYHADFLAGTDIFRKFLEAGRPYREFSEAVKKDLIDYEKARVKYLLYR